MTISIDRPPWTTEARSTRIDNVGNGVAQPEHHDFAIERLASFGNSPREIPTRVVLLRPDPSRPGTEQLFLDQVPVPREAWSYDPHDKTLNWQGAFGGGHLRLGHDGLGAYGNIGPAEDHVSVRAGARAQFSCDVATDCGASYETSGDKAIGLAWNVDSPEWKSAAWAANRLLLTYTVIPGGPMSPPSFTFEFEDKATHALPWDPDTYHADLRIGQKADRTVWFLTFKSAITPPRDSAGPTVPHTVYPLWMQAVEDAAAAGITGVLEIDKPAPQGTLIGMRGVRVQPMITGYYQTSPNAAPFGVFDGRMVVDGTPVPGVALVGDELRWTDLPSEHQQRACLPASGAVRFTPDGARATGDGVRVRRLGTTAALTAIARHSDVHPGVHSQVTRLADALADAAPKIDGLQAMSPYGQDRKGAWGDVVQAAVTDDLSTIMNSFVSADLWKLLFPDTPQPTLTGDLATIANTPVEGVADPQGWYRSLATAVLTQGMASGADDNCRYLNGPRAAAWLKAEVAASKVYAAHGALLFALHWQNHCQLTAEYLADQIDNAAAHETEIAAAVKAAVADIKANVIVDSDSAPDLIDKLIADVTNAGQYATDNKLYWAFAFYSYNVAPGCLAAIAQGMSMDTGSPDGTGLSRLFQQNVAVLTALDPSGYFGRRYTSTLNTFLATNILPSMFGFTGDAASFDLIKEYLQTFVANNLNNADKDIARAAAQIQTILNEKDADEKLHDCVEALRTISGAIQDTLALPYIAGEFVDWFSAKYSNLASAASVFSSVFIAGLTGLAVFNLFTEFKGFDKLTAAERTSLISNTLQLGLQVLAAVVKRGVRVYAMFEVTGLSTAQRTAAVTKILMAGEADQLDAGLVKIGNSVARWLGDTEGSIGGFATGESASLTAALTADTAAAAEEASFASRVFGRNLDEFIATRIGPLFILIGIGLSIYALTTGESAAALAGDILNIVGGALMIFATVGQWLVQGGLIAEGGFLADLIVLAGPLAILAAFAGVALMLYQIFKKPPDPVATFVSEHAKPAGFTVADRASSIDYARAYIDKDNGKLLKFGFTLSANGKAMSVRPDGTIAFGAATALPDCVWQVSTDGLGMSRVYTVVQPDPTKPPLLMFLSAMSDNTVSFQPAMPTAPANDKTVGAGPTVVAQTWASTPVGAAATTSEGNLVGIDLTLVAMRRPADGTSPTAKDAVGSLMPHGETVGVEQTTTPVAFHLAMSGMAPNYMTVSDVNFPLGSTPSSQQRYGPKYGVLPSTPMTYVRSGDGLPEFLTFTDETGTFAPNGKKADPAAKVVNTITATNAVGSGAATFTITVAPPK